MVRTRASRNSPIRSSAGSEECSSQKKTGKQRQAGKDPEPEITQAPLQIAKQRLPEQKGQHRPRKKER